MVARTDVGRVRDKNQDALLVADLTSATPIQMMSAFVPLDVRDRGILLAISDGMGGSQAGEVASVTTLQALLEGMTTVQAPSADVALRACVEGANAQVWNASRAPGRDGMGATLTAVLFVDRYAFVAEIGDSRAYVLRGNNLVRLTHDQTLGQQLIDAGTFTEQEADASGHRNIVTQGMGLKPNLVVAMGRFPLRRGDRFLLCSDGLSGKLNDRELQEAITSDTALDIIASKLLAMALARGGEDNITLILAELSGEGLSVMTDAERGSAIALPEYTAA